MIFFLHEMDIFDVIAYNARETIGRFQLLLNKCNV